jgi:8-oxo-dGTP pyrophosphatase MutT (NUDIX family)
MSDSGPGVDPSSAATRIEHLAACFEGNVPTLSVDAAKIQASVALILCERDADLAVLFIQRASHPGDRWSGHIAFPGGRVAAADADPEQTAVRETLEEVGLSIDRSSLVGRLNDVRGFGESILVSGFVYAVAGTPKLVPNREVASAFWRSFGELESPDRHVNRPFDYRGDELTLPAIRVLDPPHEEEPMLWGLSYHFLEFLMQKCGRQIPTMPWSPDL